MKSLDDSLNSSLSEAYLPQATHVIRPILKTNEYIRLYQHQNNTHELDRERAKSVAKNIFYNKKVAKRHPIFNKKPIPEPDVDLNANQLYSLAQLTADQMQTVNKMNSLDLHSNNPIERMVFSLLQTIVKKNTMLRNDDLFLMD
jgi:hypothetical protein